jgi:DNA-binding XRE family transcriptional regulator
LVSEFRSDGPLIDPTIVGRRLRGARITAGFDRVTDVSKALREIGVACSDRTLYAVERGEQLPGLDLLAALIMLFNPPAQLGFFFPAFRADLVAFLSRPDGAL